MAYCHRQCLPLNLGLILCQILFWSEDLMIQDFSPSIGLVFKNFLINCLLGIYLQTYIDTMLSQPYLIPTPEKLPIMFFTKKKKKKNYNENRFHFESNSIIFVQFWWCYLFCIAVYYHL